MKGGPPLRGTCSAADRLVLADHRDPLGKPAPAEVADLDLHHVAPLEVLGLVTLPLELDDRLGGVLHQDRVVGVVAIVGGRPFGGKAGTVSRGLETSRYGSGFAPDGSSSNDRYNSNDAVLVQYAA